MLLNGAQVRLFCFVFFALSQLVSPIFAQTGTVIEDRLKSRALEGNLLGDSPERSVYVYLPPSYNKSTELRYPVVYLLHGYSGDNKVWVAEDRGARIGKMMDDLIQSRDIREMLLVMPDAKNRYLGSFYTDSATNGNWEDFVARDLVAYMDAKYRTIAEARSRGIAGHSMGGYGALKLAMKNPSVFGAVYGLSPCCLGWIADLTPTNPAWNRTVEFKSTANVDEAVQDLFKSRGQGSDGWREPFYAVAFLALSAAWSPNPQKSPLFVDLPVEKRNGALLPVQNIEAKWSANMLLPTVDQHRSNLAQLRAVAFDVGTDDEFPHIVVGSRALSRALEQNGIEHVFEEYEGNHGNRIVERLRLKVLPFFSRKLNFRK